MVKSYTCHTHASDFTLTCVYRYVHIVCMYVPGYAGTQSMDFGFVIVKIKVYIGIPNRTR